MCESDVLSVALIIAYLTSHRISISLIGIYDILAANKPGLQNGIQNYAPFTEMSVF